MYLLNTLSLFIKKSKKLKGLLVSMQGVVTFRGYCRDISTDIGLDIGGS
jgi:hypothetical protein